MGTEVRAGLWPASRGQGCRGTLGSAGGGPAERRAQCVGGPRGIQVHRTGPGHLSLKS